MNSAIVRILDLVAYNQQGQIVLIIEVKGRTNRSTTWATQLRCAFYQMHSYISIIPSSQYFMLALPDKLYLWKNKGPNFDPMATPYEINPEPFFGPYYKKADVDPHDLSESSFELILNSWINVLVSCGLAPDLPCDQREILLQSGLMDALKDCRIERDVRVVDAGSISREELV